MICLLMRFVKSLMWLMQPLTEASTQTLFFTFKALDQKHVPNPMIWEPTAGGRATCCGKVFHSVA